MLGKSNASARPRDPRGHAAVVEIAAVASPVGVAVRMIRQYGVRTAQSLRAAPTLEWPVQDDFTSIDPSCPEDWQ